MNERIRLLAEQATELDYTTFDSYNHKTVEHYKFNREKFAELIVQACADFAYKEADHLEDEFERGRADDLRRWANVMKKHFGVEE